MFFFIKIFVTINVMVFILTYAKMLNLYSAEIYSTLVRGKAMGMFSLAGRIATTILGFLGVAALYWMNGNGLYLIFFVLCMLSSALIFRMPYCTLGRPLDI
jgi:hypothetical protein